MSSRPQPPGPAARGGSHGASRGGSRTLERRLLGWLLALTVAPALIILAVGGWVLAESVDFAGSVGPWEEVAESGRRVVERVEPEDPAVSAALAEHRDALSRSLTQARRWEFVERRVEQVLPWLVLFVAVALVALAYAATRQLARQLAQPIEGLVAVAEHLGRGDPLPAPPARSIHEVRVLDETLRSAAAELSAARERAVAAERLRVWGEMARRVAHEMKNPLTPLRFAAHRLARLRPAADAGAAGGAAGGAAFDEAVEVIDQEVRRLEELAAQFASLGRPPEGPPTAVDLRELLASLLETDAAGATTSLDAAPDAPPVVAHYDSLFRAFRNLIRNAIEATESVPEPRIEVVVTAETEAGAVGDEGAADVAGWLDVRIRDNGPGLPPEGGDRIFEPDFTTRTRGTGLGLALVRQAVAAAGGTIDARNLEAGAEFAVRLPVAREPTAQESA